LLKRMTTGESDCGGTLLKLNLAKAVENAARPAPPSRTSSDRPHRSKNSDETGESKRRHRERPTTSRHESSKDGSSRVDEVPAMKVKNALSNGLKAIFAVG
jgi:hypothetical protein